MARLMFGDDPAVFRTVIVTTYPAQPNSDYEPHRVERTSTHYAGPFGAKAPATAALTKAKREASRGWRGREGVTVTGYVERAPLVWERVE